MGFWFAFFVADVCGLAEAGVVEVDVDCFFDGRLAGVEGDEQAAVF